MVDHSRRLRHACHEVRSSSFVYVGVSVSVSLCSDAWPAQDVRSNSRKHLFIVGYNPAPHGDSHRIPERDARNLENVALPLTIQPIVG